MPPLKPKSKLAAKVGAAVAKVNDRTTLWRGPEADGITYSLLSRFLVCRERFRCLVVDGLRPPPEFNARIEYGQMWHACEEAFAANTGASLGYWELKLKEYVDGLFKAHTFQRDQIVHWYGICKTQFPLYVAHWARHPDAVARTPLLQEQVFDVPYRLPSGRTVRLRGKWDSVDLVGKGKAAGVWLQENKTKQRIEPDRIQRQLRFDLQTMIYIVALDAAAGAGLGSSAGDDWGSAFHAATAKHPIAGVRYNVVRRTEHRQGKKETQADFLARLRDIIEASPDEWFMRWNVTVTPADVRAFRTRCLDPILEQLCRWWDAVSNVKDPYCSDDGVPWVDGIHWQHPFGVWNVLDEGGHTDLDDYLTTGSTTGLTRVDKLFTELT